MYKLYYLNFKLNVLWIVFENLLWKVLFCLKKQVVLPER